MSGRRLATALLATAALADEVLAQEGTPSAPPPRPAATQTQTRRAKLTARNVQRIGRRDVDEVVLALEDVDLVLEDEDVELRADLAVLWGDRDVLALMPGGEGRDEDSGPLPTAPQVPPTPNRPPLRPIRRDDPVGAAVNGLREVYAEGHVYFRQGRRSPLVQARSPTKVPLGDEVVLADRLYEHLLERRGVVVEADAYAKGDYRGEPVDLHVRAQRLRSLGPDQLRAENAQFTTCAYGHPHWHVQSDSIAITTARREDGSSTTRLATSGSAFEVGDVPLLPLPPYTADVSEGDSLPLKKIRLGASTRFGPFAQTLWGDRMPETSEALREELGLSRPLDLRWETAADWYSRRGAGVGPGVLWHSPGLLDGELSSYWIHDARSSDSSTSLPIGEPQRGRGYFRDRFTPDDKWRLDTEVNWLSDPGFLPEYFEREFKEGKEPESYAHLVRQDDTTRFRALYRNRLNDYQTQVDEVPQASFDQIGFPLFRLPSPSFLERDGDPNWLVLTHSEDLADRRVRPGDGSTLSSADVGRADSLAELSTSLPLGPAQIRPFTAGRFTGWDRDAADDAAVGRAAGVVGARGELALHRDFDAFVPSLGIDGLRHVALFDVDWVDQYDVSRPHSDVTQIDAVDAFDRREVVLFALRQRLQTHRDDDVVQGPDHVVDAFALDVELPYYPQPDRDNPASPTNRTGGQSFGPLRYDFVHRPGFSAAPLRNCALFAQGEWNLRDATMDVTNLGLQLQPNLDWTTIASYREARGVSRVLTGEVDWRLQDKWSVAVLEQYDLAQRDGLRHRYEIRRHGHDFTFAIGVERSLTNGETSVTFAIYPSFFRRGRAEQSLASGRGDLTGLDPTQY